MGKYIFTSLLALSYHIVIPRFFTLRFPPHDTLIWIFRQKCFASVQSGDQFLLELTSIRPQNASSSRVSLAFWRDFL